MNTIYYVIKDIDLGYVRVFKLSDINIWCTSLFTFLFIIALRKRLNTSQSDIYQLFINMLSL